MCSFDRAQSSDADFARDLTGAGGFGVRARGRVASAQVAEMGGHLSFAAAATFSRTTGRCG